ncbi:MAG: S-layer homology domain-containing protein, partial [bacterium]|nr:S-layer homology domain-containing protein [bacterium]
PQTEEEPTMARAMAPLAVSPFVDVRANREVFAAEIAWLAQQGISTGWSDGTFRPYEPVLRDSMAAFLYRFAGSPEWARSASLSVFRDVVPGGLTFFREITWLSATGITTGWPGGTFGPYGPVNRDQMAAFLYRLAGSPDFTPPAVSPFVDVSTRHVFYKQIAWLAATGISKGWDDGTFRPFQPVLRDATAAFLHRFHTYGYTPQVTAVPPATNVVCGELPGGCFQVREGSVAYGASQGSLFTVGGAIGARWEQAGRWTSALGYPTSAERCGLAGGGCSQSFQRGTVYWTQGSGARTTVPGTAITNRWLEAGGHSGRLGYPTSDERCGLVGNQCRQDFQGGSIIYSSSHGTAAAYHETRPLFVYGTLRRGQSNYGAYLAERTYHERPARLPGHSMWLTNIAWAIPDSGNSHGIYGEVMYINTAGYWTTIARMDALERYYPNDPGASSYIRSRVTLDNGLSTWAYVASSRMQSYVTSTGRFLPSGDWTKRW